MAIGDIYELTHMTQLFGKPANNVYHVRAEVASTSAEDLAADFTEEFLPLITAIQTADVTGDRLRVIKLFDFTDFWDGLTVAQDRGAANPASPRAIAVNFTLRTNIRNIGPGAKRYAGVGRNSISQNAWTGAPLLAAFEALRAAFPIPFGSDVSDAYRFVIVKRVFYEATEDAKAGYYMPRTEPELQWAYVTNAAVAIDLSHQVSRD